MGIKNTAASLELCSTSVATRKSTSKLGSSLAAPSVACLQEKPYMNVGARLPSIARTLEYNVSRCVCVCVCVCVCLTNYLESPNNSR